MKRFQSIVLILLICTAASPLFAGGDKEPQDSPDQELRVQVYSVRYSSTRKITETVSSSMTLETPEWTPYLGARRITKEEFYRTAGFNDYADRYRSYNITHTVLSATGITATALGLVLFFLGAVGEEDSGLDKYTAMKYSGLGVAGAGLVASSVGLWLRIAETSVFSITFAISIADEYNKNLP